MFFVSYSNISQVLIHYLLLLITTLTNLNFITVSLYSTIGDLFANIIALLAITANLYSTVADLLALAATNLYSNIVDLQCITIDPILLTDWVTNTINFQIYL